LNYVAEISNKEGFEIVRKWYTQNKWSKKQLKGDPSMDTLEDDKENKDIMIQQRKSWVYIIGFLILFFLIGFCVKWLSAISHGSH
jgi:hypothetical protein